MQTIFNIINTISRRLNMFLTRENITLVTDEDFYNIINNEMKNGKQILCSICGKELSENEVMGWFVGESNKINYFCNNSNCRKKVE